MTSIRSYLVTVLIALLTLTSFLAALQGYRHSSEQAGRMFDEDLQVLAASLLDLYQEAPTATPALLPADTYQSGLNAVQVFRRGQLIYRNHSAPARPIDVASGFSEQNFLGQRWRTYRIEDTASGLTVISAQPLHGRQNLADEVVLASIYPVVLSLPLQALLIWWVVSRGLQPLRRLAEQLSVKKADDLSPLTLAEADAQGGSGHSGSHHVESRKVPCELAPVLQTTNHLLARLRLAFEREKRFAADVAHELRTPLSVLQVQLFNAEQRWIEADLPLDELNALKGGVERMSHLIEQILLLNRTNPEQFQSRLQMLDLAELCRNQIVELYPQFERKQQDIALLGEPSVMLMADAFALPLLVRNLLGNANKYTPAGGTIQLQLQQLNGAQQAQVQLTVADSGPGIAEDEYAKVFQRFYRVGGDRQRETGSGLGLAICQEIAGLHQGQLQLARSTLGGLQVTVTLPLQQSATLGQVGMSAVSLASTRSNSEPAAPTKEA